MKKILLLPVVFLFVSQLCIGQTPQAFKYQAVIRDEAGMVIANQLVSLRISILKGETNGETVYMETHGVTTNALGLVNLEIGRGLVIQGVFSQISWGEDEYFIQLEIDMEGGANYQLLGVSQLLSVPYALYAERSGFITDTTYLPWKESAEGIYYDGGNVGINNSTPDSTALLDLTSTTQGFLPPRLTQAQIEAMAGPANGLVVYCTTDDKVYVYVASAYAWKEILYGSGTITPPNECGSAFTVEHAAGNVAPVSKTVTYGIVTNVPGEPAKCWITSNLGADHQATAKNDATEASAGWYWQFNRKQGYKHDGTTRTPNTTWITSINEDYDWLEANDPCVLELGGGWRLPTPSEWNNIDAVGGWTDWNGPWNSVLKMHAAGRLIGSAGTLELRGNNGIYWSSLQSNNSLGWYFGFYSQSSGISGYDKAYGHTIRCISGTIAPPNYCGSAITVEHGAGNVAPVTKTVTYGIVTNIPGEPLKCWITSNLGADHQATSMDDATEASAGWYWQFNRMQGYKHDGEIRTPNNAWITSISENFDWQAENDPCALELGGDWRLPTNSEWNNVDESEDWSDRSDPWNSALKLHCAGSIDLSGFLIYRGSHGGFYSSNQNNNTDAWHIVFGPGYCGNVYTEKARAFSIRCLRDL
jgi:hypothetical protein